MTTIPFWQATDVSGIQLRKVLAFPAASAAAGHMEICVFSDNTVRMVDESGTSIILAQLTSGVLKHEQGGLELDVSAFDGILRITGGNTTAFKWNFASASNPTVSSDTSAGYIVGSIWLNTTTDIAYQCLDASVGAAIWHPIAFPFRGFAATHTADQTVTAGVTTLMTWDTEIFDVGSWFASNRYTPLISGYYQVNMHVSRLSGTSHYIELQKSGTRYIRSETGVSLAPLSLSTIMFLNGSTDYVEAYVNSNSTTVTKSTTRAHFSATLITPS